MRLGLLISASNLLTGLGDSDSLSRVGVHLGARHGRLRARNSVNTGRRVGSHLGLRSAVHDLIIVFSPLSTLVLLNVNGLDFVTLRVKTRARVTGKSVRTELVVRNFNNLLVQLVPATGIVLASRSSGRRVAT